MEKITVKIIDPQGLHARPAQKVSAVAAKVKSDVKISYNSKTVSMKSLMAILTLGVTGNKEVTIEVSGADEKEAIKTIEKTLKAEKLIS